MSSFSLYYYPSCFYCRMVLKEIDSKKNIQIQLRNIEENSQWRDELFEARQKNTVPVLRIEDENGGITWLPESADIISYIQKLDL